MNTYYNESKQPETQYHTILEYAVKIISENYSQPFYLMWIDECTLL